MYTSYTLRNHPMMQSLRNLYLRRYLFQRTVGLLGGGEGDGCIEAPPDGDV